MPPRPTYPSVSSVTVIRGSFPSRFLPKLRRPIRIGLDPRGHSSHRSFRAFSKRRYTFRFHRILSHAPGFPLPPVSFVSSSFVWVGSAFCFSIRFPNPHQYSPWSCCFLQMVFAQQLPGLLRPFHDGGTALPTCK